MKNGLVLENQRKDKTMRSCFVCSSDFLVKHGGKNYVNRHIQSDKHNTVAKARSNTPGIAGYFTKSGADNDVIKAEMLFTGFLVEHNLNIASSDHAGPLFKRMFPDSKIASKYGCARTKTTAIIDDVMSKNTAADIATAVCIILKN